MLGPGHTIFLRHRKALGMGNDMDHDLANLGRLPDEVSPVDCTLF